MKLNRIRQFKNSAEITITVSIDEAEQLSHALGCGTSCVRKDLESKGKILFSDLAIYFDKIWGESDLI